MGAVDLGEDGSGVSAVAEGVYHLGVERQVIELPGGAEVGFRDDDLPADAQGALGSRIVVIGAFVEDPAGEVTMPSDQTAPSFAASGNAKIAPPSAPITLLIS